MGIIQRGTSSVLVDLPPDFALRRIEQAVRKRASARVELKATRERTPLIGRMVTAATGEGIAIEFDQANIDATVQSAYCDVTFELRGEEFLFTAVVLDMDCGNAAVRLLLSQPDRVQTWQRRRFVRAAVADSAPISLGPPDVFESAGEGRILNVSQDGLACRVPQAVADAHSIGDRVGLAFAIGSIAQEMRINATLITKTAGGTRGTIILGLQFDCSPPGCPQRERLIAALREYH